MKKKSTILWQSWMYTKSYIFFYLFGLSYAMLADYLISYINVTLGELCLAAKLLFFYFSNKNQKRRRFTEKGAALPLLFHAIYRFIYH